MLAIGIGSLIFVEFIVNVAMVLGIFPVVGMPLPNGCAQLYRR
jgi:rod shape determining protein RodA